MSDTGSNTTNSNNDPANLDELHVLFNYFNNSLHWSQNNISLTNQESNYTSGNPSCSSGSSMFVSSSLQASGNKIKNNRPHNFWCIPKELYKREIGDYINSAKWNIKFYQSEIALKKLQLSKQLRACDENYCVNTLNFNKNGDFLISGSSDNSIYLWDWSRGKCLTKISDAHSFEIFQTKFLNTHGATQIISSANDGYVVLSSINNCNVVNKKVARHYGPCQSVSVQDDQPFVILSCGYDGFVKNIDVRVSNYGVAMWNTNILHVQQNDGCGVPLYGIDSNPMNPNEFIVNGDEGIVRMYDKRNIKKKPVKHFGRTLNFSANYDFNDIETAGPSIDLNMCSRFINYYITSAVYNYCGTEILASYFLEKIYLFDVNGPPNTYLRRYGGHKNCGKDKGVRFYGLKSEYVVTGSACGRIFMWDKISKDNTIVFRQHSYENGPVISSEAHPHLPMLAVNGSDNTIKIWEP